VLVSVVSGEGSEQLQSNYILRYCALIFLEELK
jgi:hypothetical protein